MIKNAQPRLIPIEIETAPDNLSDTCDYLIKFKKRWYGGRFEKTITGWIFKGVYAHGCGFDMDGWERIYKIEG